MRGVVKLSGVVAKCSTLAVKSHVVRQDLVDYVRGHANAYNMV